MKKYSFKEKVKLLRELSHPSHGKNDLALLKSIAPQCTLLASPILSAERYAERILGELLDHTTAEAIRLNRRGKEKEPDTPKNNGTTTAKKKPLSEREKEAPEGDSSPATSAAPDAPHGPAPSDVAAPGDEPPAGDATPAAPDALLNPATDDAVTSADEPPIGDATPAATDAPQSPAPDGAATSGDEPPRAEKKSDQQ